MTSASRAGAPSSSSSSPTRPPRETRPLLPRTPSALLFPPAPPPLHITVRFSIALPDLHLDIPSPQQTTVVALKHLIRGRLAAAAEAEAEAEASSNTSDNSDSDSDSDSDSNTPKRPSPSPAAQASLARLRFIHNGRILPDTSVLSAVLKAPPPPPLSHHAAAAADPKGKSRADFPAQQRVFINCSIGDALPASALTDEATLASAPPPPPPSPLSPSPRNGNTPPLRLSTTNLLFPPSQQQQQSQSQSQSQPPISTTIPTRAAARPQGFDRLLAAGLTPPEIATLRSHFRAIHTARFTPDTLPSPDSLRRMEDAWLDNDRTTTSSQRMPSSSGMTLVDDGGDGGTTAGGEDAYGLSALAGPLIQGMLIGFVFPLGVVGWLGKEDGVWSRRMQVFVVFGVLLSLSVGLVRGLTGEG